MPTINLLSKSVAEKIAAGEVVERPASVIKELVENSIDAGADRITVEIERGGITLMRVTDNGCGIAANDVPTAFLRHATSKIKVEDDLDSISTLGFRGEALAAVSAVSRVEMITAEKDSVGTVYRIEGGEETLNDEIGCEEGTIITVRDLFYNIPARMKFLKKDVSEGNAVSAVIDRMALSHPEIAFQFFRDGKRVLSTSGDGKLLNVICSVLGRDFASSLIPVEYSLDAVSVSGYICKPVACKPNRNYQFYFINGRLVKSGTAAVALDNAYKNSMMVGKYPAAVLNLSIGFDTVDVNVHPAKTEVRFSDEKKIFDCIYFAAKTALGASDTRPQINPGVTTKKAQIFPDRMAAEQYRQTVIKTAAVSDNIYAKTFPKNEVVPNGGGFIMSDSWQPQIPSNKVEPSAQLLKEEKKVVFETVKTVAEEKPQKTEEEFLSEIIDETEEVKYLGEAFKTYIIAEKGNSVFLIDKHAAHERMIFDDLKNNKAGNQMLLTPVTVTLAKEEYEVIISNPDILLKAGFETEDFGDGVVVVRTVPANLVKEDVPSLISEIAESLKNSGKVEIEKLNDIYDRVACRSAIKAGNRSTVMELEALAKRVLSGKDIMYCPHGRPVAFEISRTSLEKHFGRV